MGWSTSASSNFQVNVRFGNCAREKVKLMQPFCAIFVRLAARNMKEVGKILALLVENVRGKTLHAAPLSAKNLSMGEAAT